MNLNKLIKEALEFDPLAFAENFTGKDCQSDETTTLLGMLAHMDHSDVKKQLLLQNNDVCFNMSLEGYIKTFLEMGFVQIYQEKFISEASKKEEDFYCFWEKTRGILLHFDTFTMIKKGLNGGDWCYNFKSNDPNFWVYGSGHRTEEGIDVRYTDCREGVLSRIQELYKINRPLE
jgi:hypothetical protein